MSQEVAHPCAILIQIGSWNISLLMLNLKILETIRPDYMGKSRLCLISQKQSALWIWQTFYCLLHCTLTSTGHKEATMQQALAEDRFLCRDPCLWPQLQFQLGRCCEGGRQAGLYTVHYTKKLELVFENQDVCGWQAPVKRIFT